MKKVLVIDDDDCFHFLCERVFKRSGEDIEMKSVFDGVEALDLLKSGDYQPDLMLLDINMPRMNGHEFLAEYKKMSFGQVPIVAMLTSSDQEADRDNAMDYPFVRDYLLKPLRKENITTLKTVFAEVKNLQETTDQGHTMQIDAAKPTRIKGKVVSKTTND